MPCIASLLSAFCISYCLHGDRSTTGDWGLEKNFSYEIFARKVANAIRMRLGMQGCVSLGEKSELKSCICMGVLVWQIIDMAGTICIGIAWHERRENGEDTA